MKRKRQTGGRPTFVFARAQARAERARRSPGDFTSAHCVRSKTNRSGRPSRMVQELRLPSPAALRRRNLSLPTLGDIHKDMNTMTPTPNSIPVLPTLSQPGNALAPEAGACARAGKEIALPSAGFLDLTAANATNSILFLDIDDVLCLNERYGGYDVIDVLQQRHPNPDAVLRHVFSRRAREALKQVHCALGGHVRYVISSTWREVFGPEQLRQVFTACGLAFVAEALHEIWCTPNAIGPGERVGDIGSWLHDWHEGEPFAIVDDTYSGPSLKPSLVNAAHPFHGRVVLCDEKVGLLPEHVDPLVQALRRPFPAGVCHSPVWLRTQRAISY